MDKNHTPILRMENIHKYFPGVHALRGVSFDVLPGEVHALVGENGAGKSTLIKILAGIYQPNEGQINWQDQPTEFQSPFQAWNCGIATIHQELMVVPQLSVAENIFLGRLPHASKLFIDRKFMYKQAQEILERLEINLDAHGMVGNLPIAMQQMVEIAKALSMDASLIVMDEPTSALSQHEIDILFERIKRIRDEGKSVIFITHKLDEVFSLADRVTVLRDGSSVGTKSIEELDKTMLVRMMVDREIRVGTMRATRKPGKKILEVKDITIDGLFYNISFDLHEGEILGLAGLVGSGRTDVVSALFGLHKIEQGEVFINQTPANIRGPEDAIARHIGFVPENRKEQGLLMRMSVLENLVLPNTKKNTRQGFINSRLESQITDEYIEKLAIQTPSKFQLIGNLSGGNQQKVILARWLSISPKILIIDEPTRGIDIGARNEIHKLLRTYAENGVGILMISSEMEEIIPISDRIIVMREGRIVAQLNGNQADQETVVSYALGVTQ